jgi:hypothetical protein
MSDYIITPEEIEKYKVAIPVTGDWLSSRDPNYPVNSVSRQANRFNRDGESAYYIASGSDAMKAEVPKWQERETYRVAPTTIHLFNLASWSLDKGCYDEFLQSKADGGHGVCQQISDQLTNIPGLSGILYNSERMHAAGQTGSCAVILPHSGSLVGDTFFVRDYGNAT